MSLINQTITKPVGFEKIIQAIDLQDQGMTAQQIADEFEIGRSTLLRYISNYKKLQ